MTATLDWNRIDTALDEILSLPEAQWPAACRRLAAGDAELQRELESLLEHVGGDDPVLDRPVEISTPLDIEPELTPGVRVGAYRIVELIGHGGMGEVYRAERADGMFEQQVALKVMQPQAAQHTIRFEAERQILARLEHPGIARLIDGGVLADGRPYMVMQLVA